jgi:VIT1/CCC1 family predicted Fe2+/Mn2+ transporter
LSRPTARTKTLASAPAPTGGTPVLVWLVYGLGILAVTVVALAALFLLGAYLASGEQLTVRVSAVAVVVWGGLIALAVGTLVVRRRGGRRW